MTRVKSIRLSFGRSSAPCGSHVAPREARSHFRRPPTRSREFVRSISLHSVAVAAPSQDHSVLFPDHGRAEPLTVRFSGRAIVQSVRTSRRRRSRTCDRGCSWSALLSSALSSEDLWPRGHGVSRQNPSGVDQIAAVGPKRPHAGRARPGHGADRSLPGPAP